jgi:hypothetical protein
MKIKMELKNRRKKIKNIFLLVAMLLPCARAIRHWRVKRHFASPSQEQIQRNSSGRNLHDNLQSR